MLEKVIGRIQTLQNIMDRLPPHPTLLDVQPLYKAIHKLRLQAAVLENEDYSDEDRYGVIAHLRKRIDRMKGGLDEVQSLAALEYLYLVGNRKEQFEALKERQQQESNPSAYESRRKLLQLEIIGDVLSLIGAYLKERSEELDTSCPDYDFRCISEGSV